MKRPVYDKEMIKSLCDGRRSSSEIAEIVGCPTKYVQAQMLKNNWPRLKSGPPRGEKNPAWKGGRVIDREGYVLIPAPENHPRARRTKKNKIGRILEHRLVMEQKIGRYLLPKEVVDHIDGNKLNNHPDNLRLFESNGAHLAYTLKGKRPKWSKAGIRRLKLKKRHQKEGARVDNYNRRKKQGEIRKQQILLAREQLGKDHPFLCNTQQYLDDE